MDRAATQAANPLWDAEYARGEAPRRVWDTYTPILNPRWDGDEPGPHALRRHGRPPARPTNMSPAAISPWLRITTVPLGFNGGHGDFIGDYFRNGRLDAGYFRLQSSEDMVLENLAKYYARYVRSPFVQDAATSKAKGVMIGGAKIIWSDSVTDGRMRDMEVARVSGAVDGARLPKEVFYGLQVAQNTHPQVYVVGHWNYPAGTVKPVYVAAQHGQGEAGDARSVGERDQGLRFRRQRFRCGPQTTR